MSAPEVPGPHSLPTFATKTRATTERGGKKRHSYKPLKARFRHDGLDYRQIAREGDAVAIYEQRWPGSENVRYEVVRIRRREGFKIGNSFIEPAEVYPNSEAWGVDGFTLTDKDAAFAKLRAICKELQPFPAPNPRACAREERIRKANLTQKSPT